MIADLFRRGDCFILFTLLGRSDMTQSALTPCGSSRFSASHSPHHPICLLLGRMHFGVTLFLLILGGCRGVDNRSINEGALCCLVPSRTKRLPWNQLSIRPRNRSLRVWRRLWLYSLSAKVSCFFILVTRMMWIWIVSALSHVEDLIAGFLRNMR